MDWRQQSRSRSRAPHNMAMGGMDWRAQSRSRSRAPGSRISMNRGSSGFQLPTYIDTAQSMASAQRTDVYASRPSSAASTKLATAPPLSSNAHQPSLHNRTASGTDNYSSIEATLKQLIASAESPPSQSGSSGRKRSSATPEAAAAAVQTSRKGLEAEKKASPGRNAQPGAPALAAVNAAPSTPATPAVPATAFAYVPPAPLVAADNTWLQPMQNLADTPASSYTPSSLAQSFQSPSAIPFSTGSTIVTEGDSGSRSSQSQTSMSQSIEAYLASLEYNNTVGPAWIDLPSHRNAGSVPGLFNEQAVKHNQHAEYGFLPKLVRKTSFDASYPAQLAQRQQRQETLKGGQAGQVRTFQTYGARTMLTWPAFSLRRLLLGPCNPICRTLATNGYEARLRILRPRVHRTSMRMCPSALRPMQACLLLPCQARLQQMPPAQAKIVIAPPSMRLDGCKRPKPCKPPTTGSNSSTTTSSNSNNNNNSKCSFRCKCRCR